MATEYHRIRGRKTIELPSGDRITIPVITKLSFIDPVRRYQETEHSFDNTETSNRRVHVDEVHPVDVDEDGLAIAETPTAGTESLYVERIDTWNSVDPVRRGQEVQLTLDNTTGNDQLPPHFSNHERTHIYRYHKDPQNPDDEGTWVDSELIDEFTVIDPLNRGQETHYILANPTNAEFRDGDLSGQADASDPDITIGDGSGEGTSTNPVRLDPFQNIVNYSSGTYVVFEFIWQDTGSSPIDELCICTSTGPTVYTLFPGTPPDVITTNLAINFSEERSTDATWLNPAVTVVTTNVPRTGYAKFGPTELPCTAPHAPHPIGTTHAPSVNANTYLKTFLFDASAKIAAGPSPTEVAFDLTSIPGPRDWLVPADDFETDCDAVEYDRRATYFTSRFAFHVYVYKKSDVDVFLSDNAFPLRKKGIDPNAPTAVTQTKDAADSQSFSLTQVGWASDTAHILHEELEPDSITSAISTGLETDNQIDFLFEKFEVTAQENHSIAWPENPAVLITDTANPADVDGAPLTNQHIRRYAFTVLGPDDFPIDYTELDFGVSPDGVTA